MFLYILGSDYVWCCERQIEMPISTTTKDMATTAVSTGGMTTTKEAGKNVDIFRVLLEKRSKIYLLWEKVKSRKVPLFFDRNN